MSGTLLTVTLTAVDVLVLPAASRAMAVRLWLPLTTPVVFQPIEYGAVVTSEPMSVASTLKRTPATPTLSDALAVIVTLPDTTAPAAGAVIETVGAVVSAGPVG